MPRLTLALASNTHWSEAEILAMPLARHLRYLKELGRMRKEMAE